MNGDSMFYLGIDIGKIRMQLLLLTRKVKTYFKAFFFFSNSTDGADSLIYKLAPYVDDLRIGMEATGHYWLSLYSFFI